jgi:hypothetical protein
VEKSSQKSKTKISELNIRGSLKTPDIRYSPKNNKLQIAGKSIPENHNAFFEPVIQWLQEFKATPPEETIIDVQLEYFNTSSSKVLLKLFKTLEKIRSRNKNIEVNWYYEEDDLDMKECGLDFSAMVNLPFKFIEVEELSSPV